MPAESAKIVDLQAYRDARVRASTVPAHGAPAVFSDALPPMMMWVPVWAYVPVMPGPWLYAR